MSYILGFAYNKQFRKNYTNSNVADSKHSEHIITGGLSHINEFVLQMRIEGVITENQVPCRTEDDGVIALHSRNYFIAHNIDTTIVQSIV